MRSSPLIKFSPHNPRNTKNLSKFLDFKPTDCLLPPLTQNAGSVVMAGGTGYELCKVFSIVWFVVLGLTALETVFQSMSGLPPEGGRKKREMIDERKNVQTTPHPHLLEAQLALALHLSKLVGRPGTASLPSTIASPDHPDWLVGCFGFNGLLRQYFSLYSGRLPERGRKRRERIEESKNVQTTPTRTYCKRNRPLPYYHPNCRTPRHRTFIQDPSITPDHPEDCLEGFQPA